MDQIQFITGKLEILVDLLAKLSQHWELISSSNLAEYDTSFQAVIFLRTGTDTSFLYTCMQGIISIAKVGGLKREKRKEACPTENKLKRTKRKFDLQLLQKLQFSECVCIYFELIL